MPAFGEPHEADRAGRAVLLRLLELPLTRVCREGAGVSLAATRSPPPPGQSRTYMSFATTPP